MSIKSKIEGYFCFVFFSTCSVSQSSSEEKEDVMKYILLWIGIFYLDPHLLLHLIAILMYGN